MRETKDFGRSRTATSELVMGTHGDGGESILHVGGSVVDRATAG